MGELKYLGGIIPIIIGEYFICLGIYYLLRRYKWLKSEFFEGKSLENTSVTHLNQTKFPYSNHFLFVFRIVAFGWLGVFATIVKFVLFPSGWHYYTHWNLIIIGAYFLLAAICSAISIVGVQNHPKYSSYFEWLGKITGISYGFIASSALMVTFLNFILLNPSPEFWNVTEHLTQTLAMLVETALNSVVITPHEVLLALSWPLLWAIFIWPVVATGVRGWPYFFVRTARPSSFFWYNLLFILAVIFFVIYYYVCRLKYYLLNRVADPVGGIHSKIATIDPEAVPEPSGENPGALVDTADAQRSEANALQPIEMEGSSSLP